MTTTSEYARLLGEQMSIQPAWLPVVNTFDIGDYGLISNGVFTKMGNISDYEISWKGLPGEEAKLHLKSSGVRLVRLVNGIEVPEFPLREIQATLKIEFDSKNSIFAAAEKLTSREMQDVTEVARALKRRPGWNRRFWVVSKTYNAQHSTFLSAASDNTTLEFNGSASALAGIGAGNVSVSSEFKMEDSDQAGIMSVGNSGVIGLSLFKVGWMLSAVRTLEADDDVSIVTTQDPEFTLENDV